MLPAGGFQFAVCGLASFAATVGYAYSRKRASTSISEEPCTDEPRHKPSEDNEKPSPCTTIPCASSAPDPSASDPEKPTFIVAELGSLKRKREDEDLHTNVGYPHNLSSIYPNKRSRTPSSESDNGEMPLTEEGYLLIASPSRSMAVEQQDPAIVKSPNDIADTAASSETVHEEPEDKIHHVEQPSAGDAIVATDPPPPAVSPASEPSPTPARPPTPPAQLTPQSSSPAWGFAAFAAAGSAFRSNALDGSPSPPIAEKPIWWSNGSRQSKRFENPLAAESHVKTTYTHSTGEEDEDVECELKGAKLFIKRGQRDFTDGIIGNIKLLVHKAKHEERLLFRRDPLWQVSMNVRLHPLVRCTYDVEGNALRFILKEPVEQENVSPEEWPQELVVYALKAGRVPKEDFREFAKALVANVHFKPKGS